jgi:cytochrome c oxidase subunit 2
MKTLLKIIAVAAAFGLAPAAALGQAAPAPAPAAGKAAPAPAPGQPAAAPVASGAAPAPGGTDAASQARGGAQPQEVSGPDVATERPSDATVARSTAASAASPEVGIGQPDGRWQLQNQYTPIGREAAWFHNWILMPAITIISIFVLVLLLWVIIRYRRAANPTPSRTTHNTVIEIVWTLVPVLILVAIAVPSIQLLRHQYSPPAADLTVRSSATSGIGNMNIPITACSSSRTCSATSRRGRGASRGCSRSTTAWWCRSAPP